MSSFAGGGGGAIYEDGDAVSIHLSSSESVTVPAGETWVLQVHVDGSPGKLELNGSRVVTSSTNRENRIIAEAGDTLSEASNAQAVLMGWAL